MHWPAGGQEIKSEEAEEGKAGPSGEVAAGLRQHQHQHGGKCCQHQHQPHGAVPAGMPFMPNATGLSAIPGLRLNPQLANLPPDQLQELQERMRQQLALYQQARQQGAAGGANGDDAAGSQSALLGAGVDGVPGMASMLRLPEAPPPPPMTVLGAVKLGLLPVVRRLMEEEATEPRDKVLGAIDAEGHTLAHWAAKRGDLNMVQYLADLGAPLFVSSTDSVGMQPLHWATTEGHLSVMHFLISRGADINCLDLQRCTPLLIAAQYGQTEAVAYLVKNGADTTLLDVNHDSAVHWAAYKGELSIVQLVHQLGLPMDTLDGYGQTPLHLAALRGNLSVVEYLTLDVEVRTSVEDKNGCTPLGLAVKKEQKQVAAFLQRRQSDSTFSWRQVFSIVQWKHWLMGGGSVEVGFILTVCGSCLEAVVDTYHKCRQHQKSSPWPFYVVVASSLAVHAMYPLRFLTEEGIVGLGGYGVLHSWSVAVQLCMWVFFILAWKSNPGYILSTNDKARKEYDSELEKYSSQGMEEILTRTSSKKPALCHSCHIQRPPRAKHCKTCRRCVRVFDHHCPFIGNCVGGNNYRWFFLYIVTLLLAQVLYLTTSVLYLARCGWDTLVLLMLLYIGLISLMVTMLSFYHVQLLALNLTTNEHQNMWRYDYFKGPNGTVRNPFDAGCLRNYASRLLWTEDTSREERMLHHADNNAGQRLVDSFVLMRSQVGVVSKLLAWVWDQNASYLARLEALLSQDKSFQQIDEICKQLEATKVDAELVAGEEGHTLYDFADDTSVSSLKLEAQVALKEMLALHDKGLSAQMVLEERQLYFRQVVKALEDSLGCPPRSALTCAGPGQEAAEEEEEEEEEAALPPLDHYGLWQAIEHNVAEQEETVHHMKGALLSAASAYSRAARGQEALDMTSSMAEQERALLGVLQESIERMKDLQMAMDRFPQVLNTLRQQMRALLTDFERFQPEAAERVQAVRADHSRFSELAECVQSLLQELVSLAAFYHEFLSAYSQLGAEVNRRRRALERVAQVVNEAQAKLDRLYEEEEGERSNFYQEHGRFLPSSLCPVIQAPQARLHILPNIQDLLDRLPTMNKTPSAQFDTGTASGLGDTSGGSGGSSSLLRK